MGRKRERSGVEGLSRGLLLIRGVPVEIVGHEENVGSRWDEGMARFHNLKAQKTEGANQFSWRNTIKMLGWESEHRSQNNYVPYKMSVGYGLKRCHGKTGLLAHTTIISVLVKADKHTNNFQVFFSKLQERRKTGGRSEVSSS